MAIGYVPFAPAEARSLIDGSEAYVPDAIGGRAATPYDAQREANIPRYAAQVAADLRPAGGAAPEPGGARPVRSLTDPALPAFRSVQAAAAFVRRRPYGIIQAIHRTAAGGSGTFG